MAKRICITCGIEYPLQEKYFALAHGSTTRHTTKCRECVKEYQAEYRIRKQQEEEEIGGIMHEIKAVPEEVKKRKIFKALNYIYLQAFGEQMNHKVYWCKNDECVQIDINECGGCGSEMEEIGFVEYDGDK